MLALDNIDAFFAGKDIAFKLALGSKRGMGRVVRDPSRRA